MIVPVSLPGGVVWRVLMFQRNQSPVLFKSNSILGVREV